jgi:hypothetical protein
MWPRCMIVAAPSWSTMAPGLLEQALGQLLLSVADAGPPPGAPAFWCIPHCAAAPSPPARCRPLSSAGFLLARRPASSGGCLNFLFLLLLVNLLYEFHVPSWLRGATEGRAPSCLDIHVLTGATSTAFAFEWPGMCSPTCVLAHLLSEAHGFRQAPPAGSRVLGILLLAFTMDAVPDGFEGGPKSSGSFWCNACGGNCD